MNNFEAQRAPQPATGQQFMLRRGDAVATVVSLAAGLRHYERSGVELVESYDSSVVSPGAAGITLAPFANRIDGGRWVLNGKSQQLDITEVPHNNAIHGLLRNVGYEATEHEDHRVTLAALIYPQHGYPFLLRHEVSYELTSEGHLRVTQTLFNLSEESAPFVLGAHPYFRIGDVDPATLTISVKAHKYLVTNQRMIPTATERVSGSHDLRSPKKLADSQLDAAFTDVMMVDGEARHTLAAPDGRTVSLWHDQSVSYVQVFVTPEFPGRSLAVAMEPMTGAANAFNSGDGLKWLGAGESYFMQWGIESSL